MKKELKIGLVLISIVAIILGSCVVVFAHPGKTDSDGGHYDRSSGEYHYHHGYPAHQHDNGTCPYDFDNNEKSTENYYNYKETTTNEINSNTETETFATIIIEDNTKINSNDNIDFDSLQNKAKINDWVQEYLNNYEKLNNYYSSARKQISESGTCNSELYNELVSLNNKVIASLPNYEKYIDKDKYNEIQKQTKLYKNFLDKNAPNDSEYIETTTEYKTEETTTIINENSNLTIPERIITFFCIIFIIIYVIEVLIIIAILTFRNFKGFFSSFAYLLFIAIIFIIYLACTTFYFTSIGYIENIYLKFFLYLPAPIISTIVLIHIIKGKLNTY